LVAKAGPYYSRLPHFFGSREGERVTISGADARHLARSLRARPGERISVVDPAGWLLQVRVESVNDSVVRGHVESQVEHRPEPRLDVTMALAVLPAAAIEAALARCTEIGAAAFQLVAAERSVGRGVKLERWQTVCREAAMLAGRLVVPEVRAPMAFRDAFANASNPLVLDRDAEVRLAETNLDTSATLFIGPEGGWSPAELGLAAGRVRSLGPRNLRAENAAATALAVVLANSGDL
jgi:16S rRNA (uracil1498-N3)-methyltransferase